jgi:hypothetical protein
MYVEVFEILFLKLLNSYLEYLHITKAEAVVQTIIFIPE